MEYIRWLIKRVFDPSPILILPCFLLAIIVGGIAALIHPIISIVFLAIALIIFGTIGYVYISDAFRTSYIEFQKDKASSQK